MTILILSTIFIILLLYIIQTIFVRIRFSKLREKIGLKGPEAHWFLGNIPQLRERTKQKGYNDSYAWHQQLHKLYGETFGFYFGKRLNIVISNEEDIKEIFIKQFSKFSDRNYPPIFGETNLMSSLLQNPYSMGWKRTRSAIGPVFSTGKMKAMYATVQGKIDVLLEILEEKIGEKFDIYGDLQALTLDVIGKCAFAIDSNCQRDRNEVFYVQARKFINKIDLRASPIVGLSLILPELSWIWKVLYKYSELAAAEKPLIDGLADVYERRLAGEGAGSVDLLTLLLERDSMSKKEVIENCFAFLLAGYETTSTAMTYCAHLLSRNPEVQGKLLEEIQDQKVLDYDTIHSMKYLDAVYKETLRLYPPVIHFVNRICLEDTYIRGQLYPKGCTVSVLSYTVQRSEANWENASEFVPERFLNENSAKLDNLKWIPFGVGPRYCVGMRFAEMEFKMTIAKMVQRFQLGFHEGDGDLVPDCNGVIMRPKDDVRIRMEKRI